MKKIKKSALLLTLCMALIFSGCNSGTGENTTVGTSHAETTVETLQTNAPIYVDETQVAVTVDGNDVAIGSYIFYQLAAKTDAVNAIIAENPAAEGVTVEKLGEYTIGGKTSADWVRDRAVYYCKQLISIEQTFDKLGLSLSESEITDTQNNITSFWDTEDERISMYFGFGYETWGQYYESLGIDRAAYERACYAASKQTAIFNHYYGENGSDKSSDEELNAYINQHYAQCQYFSMQTYSFIPESEILRLADEYTAAIESGSMTVAQAKAEYIYYFKQQSILDDIEAAKAAGTEYTGDSVDSVKKSEVADDEVNAYIEKGSSKPTQAAEAKIFTLEYDKPELYVENGFYYVLCRRDILKDQAAYDKYVVYARHALNDEKFLAQFEDTINACEATLHDDVISQLS